MTSERSKRRDFLSLIFIAKSILNEVALIPVVRKGVSLQDPKNENTPDFPSIKI